MTTKPKLQKKHITHLMQMLEKLESKESEFQVLQGHAYPWPRSIRVLKKRDADCLRATVDYLRETAA